MSNYRVVSEVKYNGELIDIPDDAHDVSVEPLAHHGAVRVTYLSQVRELEI